MESFRTLSYDPKLSLKTNSCNTRFLTKKMVKNGYYGNGCFGLSSLSRFYTISSTLIRS